MTWAIAMVRSPEEHSLAERLRESGMEVYYPRCIRKVSTRGRMSKRCVPAWPGYLLVRDPQPIDDSRLYRYLQVDWERVYLSDDQVEAIRLMERLGAFQKHMESERLLGIGEAVKVATGLLQGLRGYVKDVSRGLVELDGLDFTKPVRMPMALILPQSSVE